MKKKKFDKKSKLKMENSPKHKRLKSVNEQGERSLCLNSCSTQYLLRAKSSNSVNLIISMFTYTRKNRSNSWRKKRLQTTEIWIEFYGKRRYVTMNESKYTMKRPHKKKKMHWFESLRIKRNELTKKIHPTRIIDRNSNNFCSFFVCATRTHTHTHARSESDKFKIDRKLSIKCGYRIICRNYCSLRCIHCKLQ